MGDISQIKVELLLLKTALNQGHYSYLHLLSGVDLPIKSQDYIHDFFTRHAGFEFVGFAHKKTDDENAREKAGYIYLFTRYIKDDNKLRRFITKCIKYGYIRCQKLFIINDIVPCGLKKVQIGFPLQNALPVLFCLKKNTFYQCLNIHYVLTKFLFKPCYGIHLFNFLFIIKMMNLKAVYG